MKSYQMNQEEFLSLEPGTLLRVAEGHTTFIWKNKDVIICEIEEYEIAMLLEKPRIEFTTNGLTYFYIKCLYRNVVGECALNTIDDFEVIS